MKVQGAVLNRINQNLDIEELLLEDPKSNEVLIKVMAAGLCHSDWNFVTGDSKYNKPVVLGHEGAGIIQKIGPSVTNFKIGDRVILNSGPSCGTCFDCTHNHPSICGEYSIANWNGVMLDGTTRLKNKKGESVYQLASVGCFCSHIVVPDAWCVKMDETTSFEIAAIIGCAVTTGVGSVINTANVMEGSNALVIGIGGIGASVLLGLKMRNFQNIIAIDLNSKKGNIALELGATDFIEFNPKNKKKIISLCQRIKIDYFFEAAGNTKTQALGISCLRPGGTATLIGIPPVTETTKFNAAELTRKEKTIKGSYYGTNNTSKDLKFYEKLYNNKTLNLDSLITHRYTLYQINEAYSNLLEGNHIRGVIDFK